MKLEHQVCSLELAKRLKELGVKQESLFYWMENDAEVALPVLKDGHGKMYWIDVQDNDELNRLEDISPLAEFYSAFTVAELGEMLPMVLDDFGTDAFLCSFKLEGAWDVQYVDEGNEEDGNVPEHPIQGTTEPDARAKMLIYLLENKLLTV